MVFAKKETILVGKHSIDGFLLPDGSYRVSMSGVAEAIKKDNKSYHHFLRTHTPLSRLAAKEPVEEITYAEHHIPVLGITPLACSYYWIYWGTKNNEKAIALNAAIVAQSLEDRLSFAFTGVQTPLSVSNESLVDKEELIQKINKTVSEFIQQASGIEKQYYLKCYLATSKRNEAYQYSEKSKNFKANMQMHQGYVLEALALRREYMELKRLAEKEAPGLNLPELIGIDETEWVSYEPPKRIDYGKLGIEP